MSQFVKTRNFSRHEIESFMVCVDNFKHIFENKVTTAVVNKKKQVAWENLSQQFNSMPGVTRRTAQQLSNLYKNLKRRAAKKKADDGVEIFCTGGERPSSCREPAESSHINLDNAPSPIIVEISSCSSAKALRKSNRPMPASTVAANVLAEQAVSTRKAIEKEQEVVLNLKEEEHQLNIKIKAEEHNMKMELMRTQVELVRTQVELLKTMKRRIEENPESVNIMIPQPFYAPTFFTT